MFDDWAKRTGRREPDADVAGAPCEPAPGTTAQQTTINPPPRRRGLSHHPRRLLPQVACSSFDMWPPLMAEHETPNTDCHGWVVRGTRSRRATGPEQCSRWRAAQAALSYVEKVSCSSPRSSGSAHRGCSGHSGGRTGGIETRVTAVAIKQLRRPRMSYGKGPGATS